MINMIMTWLSLKLTKNRQKVGKKTKYRKIDKKIDAQENNRSVNPLYLMIGKIDWCVEEKNGNRCLVFTSMELHSADENKLVLKKYK